MNLVTDVSSFPASTNNGKARAESLIALSVESSPTSLVGYHSSGLVLITGSRSAVVNAYQALAGTGLHCTLLVVDNSEEKNTQPTVSNVPEMYHADEIDVSGYLGAFAITVSKNAREFDFAKTTGIESGYFDMVLEISVAPSIKAEIPPPGYFWVDAQNSAEDQLQTAISEIPELVGNFEKPKYFNYDPDICAHTRSGIVACTRCIDACPTDAIFAAVEMIEVNPHLCQGGGVCATACPTGAITYAYPPAVTLLGTLRQLILNYRKAGGENAVILFYDQVQGLPIVQGAVTSLPENILPVEVEELGSVGLDAWLSALAYGAMRVELLNVKIAESTLAEIRTQLSFLNTLAQGMGFPKDLVELIECDSQFRLSEIIAQLETGINIESARFMPVGSKRTDLRIALEHLHSESPLKPDSIVLPSNAPFGDIQVDLNTCTLCMGCVSVCPASALEAGGEVPKLGFIEHNCVQCGLCEIACPESSITRSARYVFDTDARMRMRTMNEDSPFHCTRCGKAFATSAILNRMKDKLKDHWMFGKPEAIARLEMCEECRVIDMFEKEGGFDGG